MHNTRSAMANLVNRYKAVLNKCRLLNAFGTLAVTAVLTTALSVGVVGSGVGTAHAATNLGTTVDPITGELTGLSTVTGKYATVDYSRTLTTGVYTNLIKPALEDLGDEDGPYAPVDGDQGTWEDYITGVTKDVTINGTTYSEGLTWEEYVGTVTTLFGEADKYIQLIPAYTIGVAVSGTDYYATFNLYTVNDDGTTTAVEYGINLVNGYNSNASCIDIETMIKSYLTSMSTKNSNITISDINSATTTPSYTISFTENGENSATNITFNATVDDATTTKDSNITATPTDPVYAENYSGITTTSNENGGAIYLYNTSNDRLSLTSVTGDFVGNTIDCTSSGTQYGNGGAIALFTNDADGTTSIGSITGDFIGNTADRAGGAIYLFSNNMSTTTIGTITGDFIANTSNGTGGGGVANYEGTIGYIYGSFIGNTATGGGGGGAIDNYIASSKGGRSSTITGVIGNFIVNSAVGNGGAVRNVVYTYDSRDTAPTSASTIGDIIGDFIGNTAGLNGGAIYNYAHSSDTSTTLNNTAIISSVTGDFIANSAKQSGGAIFNDDNYSSTALIGVITGDFIYNTAGVNGGAIYNTSRIYTLTSNFILNSAGTHGGAIYNTGNGGEASIGTISGDFISNSAGAFGGAIYNYANGGIATIGNITGSFIGNTVALSATTATVGGAIANYSAIAECEAIIGDITGDFIGNSATKYGGAIYNDSNTYEDVVIGDIDGDFIGNYLDGDDTAINENVRGGAIYNDDTIGAISGSFIGNYILADDSNTAQGGAIYTSSDMEFVADAETIFFSDNYVTTDDGATKDYNAIFAGVDNITNDTKSRILTFSMSGSGGNVVMNDSISGNTTYTPLTVTDYSNASATVDTTTTGSEFITISSGSSTWTSQTGAHSSTTTETTTSVEVDTDKGTITTTVTVTKDGTEQSETVTIGSTADDSVSNSTSTVTTTTETIKDGDTTLAKYVTTVDGSTTTSTATVTLTNADGTKTVVTYDSSSSTAVQNAYGETTLMTGDTAYDIVIAGKGKDKNTFYLNAEVDNFGDFSIENATLFLSSYLHDDGKTTTVGGLTALDALSSVTFGTNSQLTIDMSAYEDKVMSTDGTIMADAVLTGKGAGLTVDSSSSLRITKATTGNTYTIMQGFNVASVQGEYAWDASNITMDSSLQKVTIVRDGYNDTLAEVVDGSIAITTYNVTDSSDDSSGAVAVAYTLSNDTTDATDGTAVTDTTDSSTLVDPDQDPSYFVISVVANEDSPLADSSISEIVINAANTQGFGPNSDNTGSRFLYDVSTIDGDKKQVAALEGAVSLAKVAGVSTNTYRINSSSSDALASRLNNLGDTDTVLASYDSGVGESAGSSDTVITAQGGNDDGLAKASKKYESVALWFVPMYSHDRVDGASVAGYNADFTTNIYGGVAGVDKTISDDGANALGADLYRVGVAVHAGVGETSTRGDFDSIDNDFNFGGAFVYGVAEYGNLTLSADIGFSKIYSEIDQDLSAYGFAGTKADVHSSAWGVDVRGTYRIETDSVNIVPYAGLEFVSMKTEDYQVKRADAAGGTVFNVTSDRQNIVSAPVGVTFDKQFVSEYGWTVTPQLSLGAIFAAGDLEEDSLITMPGVAGSGRTSMEVVDPITFDMAVGMALMKGDWTLGLDYELQMSENRTGHALVGLVQYRF